MTYRIRRQGDVSGQEAGGRIGSGGRGTYRVRRQGDVSGPFIEEGLDARCMQARMLSWGVWQGLLF